MVTKPEWWAPVLLVPQLPFSEVTITRNSLELIFLFALLSLRGFLTSEVLCNSLYTVLSIKAFLVNFFQQTVSLRN